MAGKRQPDPDRKRMIRRQHFEREIGRIETKVQWAEAVDRARGSKELDGFLGNFVWFSESPIVPTNANRWELQLYEQLVRRLSASGELDVKEGRDRLSELEAELAKKPF